MGFEIEENPQNPTISEPKQAFSPNYFIIKYSNEQERKYLAENIIKLVNKHEIFDFHIEEKKAFEETRIIYNYHTLVKGVNWNFEKLEEEFLKVYDE